MLKLAKVKRPKVQVRIGSYLQLPLDDVCADAVVSSDSFHHYDADDCVIAIGKWILF